MQPIKYKDVNGYFLTVEQVEYAAAVKRAKDELENHLEDLKYRLAVAEKDVEIARNESKYKLKKLANIIERKDKQIAELKARLGEV
jgi:hypothetical protein